MLLCHIGAGGFLRQNPRPGGGRGLGLEFPESVTNQEGKSMYVKETAQTETTVRGMRDTVLFTALPCPASG